MQLVDLTLLKYRKNPHLIIKESFNYHNSIEELYDYIMALHVFGLSSLAFQVEKLAPKYGLKLEPIVLETKF